MNLSKIRCEKLETKENAYFRMKFSVTIAWDSGLKRFNLKKTYQHNYANKCVKISNRMNTAFKKSSFFQCEERACFVSSTSFSRAKEDIKHCDI